MLTWQARLDAAASEQQVVAVAREYMATLSAGDLSRLPEPCRPGSFQCGQDVSDYGFALVRHHCITDGASARLVTRLSDFVSRAEARLRQLSAH
jgi:hypothetical protein